MLDGRKVAADTFCDVYNLLEPWIDHGFWDFGTYEPEPNSICVVGRKQTFEHADKVKDLCRQNCQVVFANSAEGSSTQLSQLRALGLEQLVLEKKLLLLTGGRLPPEYPHLLHEHFLVRVLAFDENISEMSKILEIFKKVHKPYSFLFLNGRARPHRKYLYEKLRLDNVLDSSLWTMLDSNSTGNRLLSLRQNGCELMSNRSPIQTLPLQYEVSRYRNNSIIQDSNLPHFIKFKIFNDEWGEIYLEAAPYIDTYFSLVTETILEYPYSFFTEKIAKPLAIGHPWIAATNSGFYRDIKNLGFRTFGHVVDESFDSIENTQDRMNRIAEIVKDLCQQDLPAFLTECESVCKYNQQHLYHVVQQENLSFPSRFSHFLKQYE